MGKKFEQLLTFFRIDYLLVRLRFKKAQSKVFFATVRGEFYKYLFVVFIGSGIILALGYVFNILPIPWKPWTTTTLFTILLTLIIGFLALPWFLFKDNAEAFNHLLRIKADPLNKGLRQDVKTYLGKTLDTTLTKLIKLSENQQLTDTHYNQFRFARIFSSLADDYFWATSFDIPSEFPIKNRDYLSSMKQTPLKGFHEKAIKLPKKARIYFITYIDLIKDIVENDDYLKEVVEFHLDFDDHRKKLVNSLKFFFYDPTEKQYERYFAQVLEDLDASVVYDFMVLDDKLVYGRHEPHVISAIGGNVNLILYNKKEVNDDSVDKYKQIYKMLWRESMDLNQIITTLRENTQFDSIIQEAIEQYCNQKYIEDVAGIKNGVNNFFKELELLLKRSENQQQIKEYYKNHFSHLEGTFFFNDWKDKIRLAKGNSVAIDSTNRKTNKKFYKVWQKNFSESYREYHDFFEASKNNEQKNKLTRVFIVEDYFEPGERDELMLFLAECTANDIQVGIIRKDQIKMETPKLKKFSDFILVNVSVDNASPLKDTLGFTLEDREFKRETLTLQRNSIVNTEFQLYLDTFNGLWEKSVRFLTRENVREKIDEVINNPTKQP